MSKEDKIHEKERKIRKLKEEKKQYKEMKNTLNEVVQDLSASKSSINEGIREFKENYISDSALLKMKSDSASDDLNQLNNMCNTINSDILPECSRKIKSIERKIDDLEDEIEDIKKQDDE